MKALKTNKFKVGDEVEIVSLMETIERFGGEDFLLPIGSISVVKAVCEDNDEIELEDDLLYDTDDLKIIKSADAINTSQDESINKGIESDGGSSDYYFTSLPKHMIDQIVKTGGIEIKDIARYVYDNNADAFNIIKAQKRIIEANKGVGKAGITKLYDAKKISFFANEQYEAIKREGNNG